MSSQPSHTAGTFDKIVGDAKTSLGFNSGREQHAHGQVEQHAANNQSRLDQVPGVGTFTNPSHSHGVLNEVTGKVKAALGIAGGDTQKHSGQVEKSAASHKDQATGLKDNFVGTLKKGEGIVTGDTSRENEGKFQNQKGDVRKNVLGTS